MVMMRVSVMSSVQTGVNDAAAVVKDEVLVVVAGFANSRFVLVSVAAGVVFSQYTTNSKRKFRLFARR